MTHSCILKFFILPANDSNSFKNQKIDIVLEALRLSYLFQTSHVKISQKPMKHKWPGTVPSTTLIVHGGQFRPPLDAHGQYLSFRKKKKRRFKVTQSHQCSNLSQDQATESHKSLDTLERTSFPRNPM